MPGSPSSSKLDKVRWLASHQDLWEGMPISYPSDNEWRDKLYVIARKMMKAGLYSRKTFLRDITPSVCKLIQKVRTLRRAGIPIE